MAKKGKTKTHVHGDRTSKNGIKSVPLEVCLIYKINIDS